MQRRGFRLRLTGLAVTFAVGLGMLIASAVPAAAATYALKTEVWGSWIQYSQQETSWCWAAATKAMIQKKNGSSPDECSIVNNGLHTAPYSTCPNSGGSQANVMDAMSASGVTPVYYSSAPAFATIRTETTSGRGLAATIVWTSGANGAHMMPLIGSDSSNRIFVTTINTTSVHGVWIDYNSYIHGTDGEPYPYYPSWVVGYR